MSSIDIKLPHDVANIIWREFKPYDSIHIAYCTELKNKKCILEILNISKILSEYKNIDSFAIKLKYDNDNVIYFNLIRSIYDELNINAPFSHLSFIDRQKISKIIDNKLSDLVDYGEIDKMINAINEKGIPKEICLIINNIRYYNYNERSLYEFNSNKYRCDYNHIDEYKYTPLDNLFNMEIYIYDELIE